MKFINITDIRTKIAEIAKGAPEDQELVLLKNGKPTLAVLPYDDFARYKEWKDAEDKRKLLKAYTNLINEADRLGLGEKFLAKKGLTRDKVSDEDLLDLIANE
jgi:Antitoxin Phd_YefM, type II toxin-antitoxin system